MLLDDQTVIEYLPIVRRLVRRRAHYYPNLYDEIYGVAHLALVKCVREAEERMYNDDVHKYICGNVNNAITNFLNKEFHANSEVKTFHFGTDKEPDKQFNLVDCRPLSELLDSYKLFGTERLLAKMLYEGYTLVEIGKVLGVTKQRVDQLADKLRAHMERIIHANRRVLGLRQKAHPAECGMFS